MGMQLISGVMCMALLVSSLPQPVQAQDSAAAPAASTDQNYSNQQLDALLAPIALYPDQLLTQILMASAYADEVKAADAWVKDPAHRNLTGDALDKALAPENWDPSVKSLVPFPQVLGMMSDNADWTGQLGYAMSVQQSDVMASVQRLRQQAQTAGQLQSNAQQSVSTQGSTIVIAPAQPNVVYVPVYNPTVVYGAWPYPSYPPVYYPPPPAYGLGNALLRGMAFGAGVAITASLWGWASPNWGRGNVNINVNRYNNINVNRPPIRNGNWQANRPGGGWRPPAGGPVGKPRPQHGIPANGFGRPSISVPGNIARPPAGMGPRPNAPKPPIGQGGGKPAIDQGGNKPPMGQGGSKPPMGQGGSKPPMGQGGNKPAFNPPANRPQAGQGNRPAAGHREGGGPGAFSGMGDGKAASQFGNRGAQSQHFSGGGGARAGGGGLGGGRADGRHR
jgi:uncharacterized membrane protein YgcG